MQEIDNKFLFQSIKNLNLPIGKYAIFGSGPMGIRGLKECSDVDIVVTQDLWNEYKNKNWKIEKTPRDSEYLCSGVIELWKDWYPGEWNIEELIKESEIIDGLSFVRLGAVLKSKKLSARDKDLKDIETIEIFLSKRKYENNKI